MQFRARHADGHQITLETRGRALRSPNGPPTRAVFITRDITAMAQTQAALTENLAKIRAIIDAAVDGITVIDRDGVILEVSPASESMYGIPDELRRGHPVIDFVHYNDQAVVTSAIRRTFDEGQAQTARFRVRHDDGHWNGGLESAREGAGQRRRPPGRRGGSSPRDISESVALERTLEIARAEARAPRRGRERVHVAHES